MGMNVWFPTTIQAGWKHWAIVQPKYIISQFNLEKVAKNILQWEQMQKFLLKWMKPCSGLKAHEVHIEIFLMPQPRSYNFRLHK